MAWRVHTRASVFEHVSMCGTRRRCVSGTTAKKCSETQKEIQKQQKNFHTESHKKKTEREVEHQRWHDMCASSMFHPRSLQPKTLQPRPCDTSDLELQDALDGSRMVDLVGVPIQCMLIQTYQHQQWSVFNSSAPNLSRARSKLLVVRNGHLS